MANSLATTPERVDEIDSAGARDSADKNNSNYRRQVINQFLA